MPRPHPPAERVYSLVTLRRNLEVFIKRLFLLQHVMSRWHRTVEEGRQEAGPDVIIIFVIAHLEHVVYIQNE